MVLGSDGIGLPEGLALESGGQIHRGRAVEERLGEAGGDGRPRRDPGGQPARGAFEVGRGNDAVDQSYPERLGRVDDLRGQDQLLGLGQPHESLEEPGSAAVGNEADLEEDLPESRAVRGHDHVAPERDVAPGAHGEAVDHGDDGLGEVEEAEHEAIQELDPRAALGGRVLLPHALDVTSCAEVAARSRQDDDARPRIALDVVEGLHELLAHGQVEGVARLGTIEGEGGDALDRIQDDRLISHAVTARPSRGRWAPCLGHYTAACYDFAMPFGAILRAFPRDCMRLGATLGIPRVAAVATLLLVVIVEGCAVTAETAAARKPPPPLPVAELLLVGFGGTQVEGNEELQSLVCDIKVGGLVLFERQGGTGEPRNILGPEQVHQLTSDLQALAMKCAGRPLFIAADNEGGLVMRLSTRVGYLPTPAPRALGEAGDVAATELEARRMAATLREAGINWNLAPVVDVAVNPLNPAVVTLGRTFSSDPDRVIAHARAFILGMHEAGVLTSLKHFPGHGSSLKDSHLGFVDVTDTADLKLELKPYRALIKEGLADSVMTAHVFNRGIDPWNPATLSRFTIKRYLRGRLKYAGPVVSDDLLMGAIRQRYGVEEAAVLALQASVDILLISQNQGKVERGTAERVVAEIRSAIADGRLSRKSVSAALERVRTFRNRLLIP